jgi:hypothetical protein
MTGKEGGDFSYGRACFAYRIPVIRDIVDFLGERGTVFEHFAETDHGDSVSQTCSFRHRDGGRDMFLMVVAHCNKSGLLHIVKPFPKPKEGTTK